MKYNNITALYFSPTLTTAKIVRAISYSAGKELGIPVKEKDITSAAQRKEKIRFRHGDIVIFGSPVYIGRMPNLISPYYRTINGYGAIGIPVVLYGNRNYDDGLIELRDIMAGNGFSIPAAAAFVGEHSFSRKLAAGRPDTGDMKKAEEFGKTIARTLDENAETYETPHIVDVPGTPYPYGGFYRATDMQGKPVDIRKVKPVTDNILCNKCGLCAEICPMGAIDRNDFSQTPGICIKCGACIKRCPAGAKSIADSIYMSHLAVLEEKFGGIRREPEIFIAGRNFLSTP